MNTNLKLALGNALKSSKLAGSLMSALAALSGNLAVRIIPSAKTKAATSAAWTESVEIEIVDTDGNLCDWLTKSFATTLSIADSSAGTASIVSTTLSIVEGKATEIGRAHV